MPPTSPPGPESGHFHAVRFYENAEALTRIVADFIGEGLGQSAPALVIATPEHQGTLELQLIARGFDVARLMLVGDLTMIDAETTLRKFMRNGKPDAVLFKDTMVALLARIVQGRENHTVRAYGEMVDLLWRAGHTVAAVKLEMLWNELARSHDFALLCGYSMGNFYKDASVEEICGQHTHVVSSSGALAPVEERASPGASPRLRREEKEQEETPGAS